MIFSSLVFLYLFLPICLISYAAVRSVRAKNLVLIIFSLIFYAWGEPTRIVFLLLSAGVNYLCGLAVWNKNPEWLRKIFLTLSLLFNLGMIGYFKYSGFLMENINLLFRKALPCSGGRTARRYQLLYVPGHFLCGGLLLGKGRGTGQSAEIPAVHRTVPAADRRPDRPLFHHRRGDRRPQDDRADLSEGLTRFVIGLAKKVILANQLFRIVDQFLGGTPESS